MARSYLVVLSLHLSLTHSGHSDKYTIYIQTHKHSVAFLKIAARGFCYFSSYYELFVML